MAVFGLAELLLNSLHLLIQVVLALCLLHLALHAAADALFDLHDSDFAFHVTVHLLKAVGDVEGFEQILLFRDFQVEVAGDAVSQLGRFFDAGNGHKGFGWDALVEFNVLLKLRNDGAHQRFDVFAHHVTLLHRRGIGFKVGAIVFNVHQCGARLAFDQDLDRSIRQLEQLQHSRNRPQSVKIARCRAVFLRVLLRHQKDLLVPLHHGFKRRNGLIAPYEEGDDHVRENHNVLQGENWAVRRAAGTHMSGVLSPRDRPDTGGGSALGRRYRAMTTHPICCTGDEPNAVRRTLPAYCLSSPNTGSGAMSQ